MEPYYERDGITIFHGDCLEIMPHLLQDSVHLIFVDWPYFNFIKESWDQQWQTEEDFFEWIEKTLAEARRILTQNGSFYGCASPKMASKIELKVSEFFNVLNNIRWYKPSGWYRRASKEIIRSYLSPWEAVIFAEQYCSIGHYIKLERERAGVSRNQVDIALGYTRSRNATQGTSLCLRWEEGSSIPSKADYLKLRGYLNTLNGRSDYLRQDFNDLCRPFNGNQFLCSDIWNFAPVTHYHGKHPAEKPLALLEHIIRTSSRKGDVVLDFCMGNGTTLRAAKNLGRRAIGIDMNRSYCEQAILKMSQPCLLPEDFLETMATAQTRPPLPIVMPEQKSLFEADREL